MLNKFRNNDKGFTLVELMMVIVILGVLAGVAIPMVGRMRTNALKAKLGSYADSVGTALILEKMANSSFEIGSDIGTKVALLVSFQGDTVVVTNSKPDPIEENTLVITPILDGEDEETAAQIGFTIQAYAKGSETDLFTEAPKSFTFAQ